MSHGLSDLKRVVTSSGVYAIGSIAQRGLAFLLLPIYTRFLAPADYGALELLNALSAILFSLLLLGQPSAITKCYHRDCKTASQRRRVLATAILLDLPILLLGSGLLLIFADNVGQLVIGRSGMAEMVRLMVGAGLFTGLTTMVLSNLRAKERAAAYITINLCQFGSAMVLNIFLVVYVGLGLSGVLWGNLISTVLAFPIALFASRRDAVLTFSRRLARPLFHFGVLLLPVLLSGWIINLSDRWVLRLFRSLEEVAIYGVGYKIGTVLQLVVVWPFQLAWPAVSFSISHREGHRESFARTLTYLSLALVFGALGLSLVSRVALPIVVGEGFREAYRVVPLVTLAYVLNGVHYCLSPGVHISGHTRYLSIFSSLAAAINLGLNFLLIPPFGMYGAMGATVAAFLFVGASTAVLSQRIYPLAHEYGRLLKILLAGGLVFGVAVSFEPGGLVPGLVWHLAMACVAFPGLLIALGFLQDEERALLGSTLQRLRGRGR